VVVLAVATFEVIISRAEPILKARLLQALSERFHARVELGDFDVSLLRGFQVSGKDLAIYPTISPPARPLSLPGTLPFAPIIQAFCGLRSI
jgi:hypothetical protein